MDNNKGKETVVEPNPNVDRPTTLQLQASRVAMCSSKNDNEKDNETEVESSPTVDRYTTTQQQESKVAVCSKVDNEKGNDTELELSPIVDRYTTSQLRQSKVAVSMKIGNKKHTENTVDRSPTKSKPLRHSLSFLSDGELTEILKRARENFKISISAVNDKPVVTSSIVKDIHATSNESDPYSNTQIKSVSESRKKVSSSVSEIIEETMEPVESKGGSYVNIIDTMLGTERSATKDSNMPSDIPIVNGSSASGIEKILDARKCGINDSNIPCNPQVNGICNSHSGSQERIPNRRKHASTSTPEEDRNVSIEYQMEKATRDNSPLNVDHLEATIKNLEKKIEDQGNDIVILKSALADALRRITVVEGEKKQPVSPRLLSCTSLAGLPSATILPSQPKTPIAATAKKATNETPQDEDNLNVFTSSSEKSQPLPSRGRVKKPVNPEFAKRRAQSANDLSIKQSPTSPVSCFNPSNFEMKRRPGLQRKGSSEGNRKSTSNLTSPAKEEQTQKDESMTKFYIRGRAVTTYAPSTYQETKQNGQESNKKLQLEWVYGYRGRDCRNNLFLLPSGELVYHIAAVVILLNRSTGKQRHYLGHNDDIKCLTLHPGRVWIASGQVAGHDKDEGKPHVRIWDCNTLETAIVLGLGYFERAMCCLSFSVEDGGKYLIAVDEANEHTVSLWDWEKNSRVAENKGSTDAVLGIEFNPTNHSSIVQYGRSHICFWTVTEDMRLSKKMGVFEKYGKPKFVLCAVFVSSSADLLTGDSNGNIFVWGQGNRIIKAIKEAHDGPVFSLCPMSNGTLLSGGGKDRKIICWDENYKRTDDENEVPIHSGSVRTMIEGVQQDDEDQEIIVGTTKNCILDGTIKSGLGYIVQGHVDEMWGLATHSTKPIFVSCAYDAIIYLWDAEGHDVIWHKQLTEPAQSAALHPHCPVIAVGMKSGRWLILDADTSDEIVSFQDGPEQHDAIKFSPDGKYIAVGSHDNFIYLYSCSVDAQKYKKIGKLAGHSSYVTHLDWSKNSQCIQSNSGDYEILYWHVPTCRQIVSAYSMRDIEWETWTCVLGFPVIGIWPEGADGTDINACCGSKSSEVLATGDDFGQVNFFSFPCTKPKSQCQHCSGHSSHVTCVRFLNNDSHVLSSGGKDCSVMQWKIT